MTLTGGACLPTFYCYLKVRRDASMLAKAAAGALIITVFEFFVGIVVNMWYGWDVWDYSGKMLNILGQVCPEYSLAWFFDMFYCTGSFGRYEQHVSCASAGNTCTL